MKILVKEKTLPDTHYAELTVFQKAKTYIIDAIYYTTTRKMGPEQSYTMEYPGQFDFDAFKKEIEAGLSEHEVEVLKGDN